MKKLVLLFFCSLLMLGKTEAQEEWKQTDLENVPKNIQVMHPKKYLVYKLDEASLKSQFYNLSLNPKEAKIISLPLPNGSFRNFKVWQTPIMPNQLAAKYPEIKTYTGEAINNSTITAKLDFNINGFHAMIYDGENTSFIDPFDRYSDGYYMVHYMKDETKPESQRMKCLVANAKHDVIENGIIEKQNTNIASKLYSNGKQLRTYRLALCADSFYCHAATGLFLPTRHQALGCMSTTMHRINGVFNRELSINMEFCANEDTLVFGCDSAINGNDPFALIDGNGSACMSVNQSVCRNRIGSANFDVGHVFTTGGGGISLEACVCDTNNNAQSVTGQPNPVGDGFDINYVAHEMGHEFGSEHTFNDNAIGSCNGNAVAEYAYEPGSGTTIMAYAGICNPDDLAANSDAYFHATSLIMINSFITHAGEACAVKSITSNYPVHVDSFAKSYSIPFLTPFELTSPIAVDSMIADTLTNYCWEQWNLGDFGKTFIQTHNSGPLFRSFSPTISPKRVFPRIENVINGILDDSGHENAQGEKVPDSARYLTFILTVRDIYNGVGCFLIPSDTIHLDVINTGAGFTISSQSSIGIAYDGGSTQTLTWNMAGTGAPPISTPYVDVYMSVNGGIDWMYHIGTFPNTGSAMVTIPNPPVSTNQARFKVKGTNNVFFNVNTTNFSVIYDNTKPISSYTNNFTNKATDLNLFPNPAKNTIHVSCQLNTNFQTTIFNAIGQEIWKGILSEDSELSVTNWKKGIYYMISINSYNEHIVKKFVVE